MWLVFGIMWKIKSKEFSVSMGKFCIGIMTFFRTYKKLYSLAISGLFVNKMKVYDDALEMMVFDTIVFYAKTVSYLRSKFQLLN